MSTLTLRNFSGRLASALLVFAIGNSALAAPPTMVEVVEGLNRLDDADKNYFFKTEWGDAGQLNDGQDYGYDEYIRNSHIRPQAFNNKEDASAGGVAMFHFNIFAEGYWRSRDHEASREQLLQQQPWLKWNSTTNSYSLERGQSAATALLTPYVQNGKVKLYRGVGPQGLAFLNRVKAGDRSELSAERVGNDGAIHFTPDRAEATGVWASTAVVEIELSVNDFPLVYAGVEFRYVEVALGSQALVNSIDSLVVHPVSRAH